MRLIKLSNDGHAIVDDEDYQRVNLHLWRFVECNTSTKVETRIKGQHIALHRFVLEITDPIILVDHRDMNTRNNQKNNLRVATHSQNFANRNKPKSNTSGYKGVSFYQNRFVATLTCDGTKYYLGRFRSAEDAARAYDRKAKEMFGEFARLNFPTGPN